MEIKNLTQFNAVNNLYKDIFMKKHNLIPSVEDKRDYKIDSLCEYIPSSMELNMPHVKNQWTASTCAAFAGSTLMEYFYKATIGDECLFSTQFIYGSREGYPNGAGMQLRNVLKTLHKKGVPPYEKFKGNANCTKAVTNVTNCSTDVMTEASVNKIDSYYRLDGEKEIKSCLMVHGPVLASIPVPKKLKVRKGVFTPRSKEFDGNHAIVIYGWNSKGWLVQNSWGILWGKGGRCILPYDYTINESWGVHRGSDIKLIKFKSTLWNRILCTVRNLIDSLIYREK